MTERKATLTVRLIKNFEYRTFRNIILHDLDLTTLTLNHLIPIIKTQIAASKVLVRLFTGHPFDTFKIYSHAHGAKTSIAIINTSNDLEWVLRDYDKPLHAYGIGHESEVSWFVWQDYLEWKMNPTERKW